MKGEEGKPCLLSSFHLRAGVLHAEETLAGIGIDKEGRCPSSSFLFSWPNPGHWRGGEEPGLLRAVLPVPHRDFAFAKEVVVEILQNAASYTWEPLRFESRCVSLLPPPQVRFCMCIYNHFSSRFASKVLVLISRAANSCQPHPGGFTSKIIPSFGQHLQPNGKKLQMKSQHRRLPAMPPL